MGCLLARGSRINPDFLRRSNRKHLWWWQWWADLSPEIPPLSLSPRQSTYQAEETGTKPVLSKRVEVVTAPLSWANYIVTNYHYLRKPLHPKALPLSYAILIDGIPVGTFIVGTPHMRRITGLFGKDTRLNLNHITQSELETFRPVWLRKLLVSVCDRRPHGGYESWDHLFQLNEDFHLPNDPRWQECQRKFKLSELDILPSSWQVVMLSRVWLHPSVQKIQILDKEGKPRLTSEGSSMQLNVASCALSKLLKRIQKDWLMHHPPKKIDDPYHILRVISWADTEGSGHTGTIYRASGFYEFSRSQKAKPTTKGNRGAKSGTEKICYVFNLEPPKWEAPLVQLSVPL